MTRPLDGRSILIVEDEPLVALDVADGLKAAGATVIIARTLSDALLKADDPNLSAAILDQKLSDSDTSAVCEKLKERDIPFVIYSGYSKLEGACSAGELVQKPAGRDIIVATVAGLLSGRPIAN